MYLVSACLSGCNCRYDSCNSKNEKVQKLVNAGKAIPICPEQLGGLTTPRASCEITVDEKGNKRTISKNGRDYTKEFLLGAQLTLAICRVMGIKKAILKSNSPSCGKGLVYDGTFSGKLVSGNGLTAELLMKNGICVENEGD